MDHPIRRRPALTDVVPAPALVRPDDGAGFELDTAVGVVVAAGEPEVATIARRAATLIGDALGAEVPVLAGTGGSPGAVALTLADDLRDLGDEGYTLQVSRSGVSIRAGTPAGLYYGVQTLAQLLPPAPAPHWIVPGGQIRDTPRFPYRGVMLDVARHFFDVAAVKRLIDLSAGHKLNHLHLHLTDDQGWRLAIRSWPRLTTYGGATEVGGGEGGWYHQDDYRDTVAYAAAHQVTVVPEIDLPGHTNAALASYAELNPSGVAPARYTGTEVGFSSLAADREMTYRFLDAVVGEVAALTPGRYLHIGGDEALSMSAEEYATIVTRAQDIVAAHGKTVIAWHEAVRSKLAGTTVLQFWGTTPDAPEVVAAGNRGHRIIMSPANRSYLDMKYDADSPVGLDWAGYVGLADAYGWDPAGYLPGLDPAAILGVECPLWTETVRTVRDIEYLAFPRLVAVAELGWSPPATRDWTDFRRRVGAQAPRWRALDLAYHRTTEVEWVDG